MVELLEYHGSLSDGEPVSRLFEVEGAGHLYESGDGIFRIDL